MLQKGFVTLALLGVLFSQTLAQTCNSRDLNPYRQFGSLTLYGRNSEAVDENLPGCQPTMLFMLIRNAVRTPTQEELNQFEQRLPGLRERILNSRTSQLCQEDINELRNWVLLVNSSTTDLLTFHGEDDMKRLAQRMRTRLPELMNRQYNANDFLIRHAYRTDRANSATAFAEGLGFNASAAYGPTQIERDLLLQFSENCQSDDNEIDDDFLEDYLELEEVKRMVEGITARLGLEPGTVSLDDIDAMYKMCAYDNALRGSPAWCAAFVRSDLELLEVKEDLVTAELYGYEDDINMKETCVLLKDFVARLNDRQMQASQLPAVVTYFAKLETLLPFFTSLGLFEDDDLEIEDGIAQLRNRNWKTSVISPFMGNIAVTMYQCQGQTGVPSYSIKVSVNEVPVVLPQCEATVCPLTDLMEMIEDFAEECSYEEICDGVSATSASVTVLAFMALISTLYACLFS